LSNPITPTTSIVPRRGKRERWSVDVVRVEQLASRAFRLAVFLDDRGLPGEAAAARNLGNDVHGLVCIAVNRGRRLSGGDS
jgi:hypothetical protein